MLSAIAEVNSKRVILLGLTESDVTKLMCSNQPIHVNSTTHKGVIPDDLDLMIVYGSTEQKIADAMMKMGMVNRDATHIIEKDNATQDQKASN